MRRTLLAVALSLAAVLILAFQPVAAHPADSYVPNELDPAYGAEWGYGLFDEWSLGDITFTQPYPDPATLTAAERYIIAGATSDAPDRPLSRRLHPWWREVWFAATNYYAHEGSLPAQLNEQIVRSLYPEPEDAPQAWVDHFRSPLTGEFPRLDAAEFSPGDLYLRIMTEEEIQHFAALLPPLDRLYNQQEIENPLTGEYIEAHVTGPVAYIRVYGLSGVIYDNIQYDTAIDDPDFSIP